MKIHLMKKKWTTSPTHNTTHPRPPHRTTKFNENHTGKTYHFHDFISHLFLYIYNFVTVSNSLNFIYLVLVLVPDNHCCYGKLRKRGMECVSIPQLCVCFFVYMSRTLLLLWKICFISHLIIDKQKKKRKWNSDVNLINCNWMMGILYIWLDWIWFGMTIIKWHTY